MSDTGQEISRARGPRSAGVIAPPPLIYGFALAAGLAAQMFFPIAIAPEAKYLRWIAGGILGLVGLALSISVMRVFSAAGTPVTPWLGTQRLVVAGPYRYSRNPDYIGQTLLYLGIAVASDSWWPFVLLPLVLVVMQYGVIRREERYLQALFGEEYRSYMARVGRWL